MSEFLPAVEYVLAREGGYVNLHDDMGGETNFGITQKMYNRYLSNIRDDRKLSVKDMSRDTAIKVYDMMFWRGKLYDKIINQKLCNYIFDMSVNMGYAQSIKLVQRSLWAANHEISFVDDDGIMGSRTLDEINNAGAVLLNPLIAERAGFYRCLAAANDSQKQFLEGWLNRCYHVA